MEKKSYEIQTDESFTIIMVIIINVTERLVRWSAKYRKNEEAIWKHMKYEKSRRKIEAGKGGWKKIYDRWALQFKCDIFFKLTCLYLLNGPFIISSIFMVVCFIFVHVYEFN